VVAHREAGAEGYLSLSLVPDLYSLGAEAARAATVVFLLDVSGSMEGDAIREARAALRLCLRHLRAGDRFNIIAFSSSHRCFSVAPLGFTEETLARADRWIEARQADGGTELLEPLTRATAMADGGVVILLTDGQVGNEDEILRAVMQRRGASRTRVCSFGIGTNVSDALLRDLARETGGAVEFIHPGERIDEKVVAQFARSVAPRITDVRVRFEGLDVGEVAPAAAPDVVDGEAWSLHARYARGGVGAVEIQGRYRGEPYSLRVPLALPEEASRPVVAQLWAAERIRDLEAARVEGRRADTMKQRIVALSVAHGVASRFTSFVVVEHRSGDRRATAMPEAAVVPVNAPAGWAMFDAAPAPAARPMPAGATTSRAAPALKRKRAMPPMGPLPSAVMSTLAPFTARAVVSAGVSGRFASYDAMPVDDDAEMACDAFADDAMEREVDAFVAMDEAPRHAAPPKASKAIGRGGGGAAREEARAGSRPARAIETLGELFARQLASGLWDDASGGADAELRQLGATVRVLVRLVTEGVDAAHPLYGAPLRKAIDAVITLARDCAGRDPARSELALGAAWLLATGPRTRSALRVVIDAGPFAVVAAKRQNTDELRAWVLAATI
jgi:Ca-activated chloride channel family protein